MKKAALAAAALVAMTTGMSAAQDAPLKLIYVSSSDTGNAFWLSVKKGMDEACALIKADCQMILNAPGADEQGQISNIQAAIAQKPDVLVTNISNDEVFDQVIQDAIDAGITVLASNVDDTKGAQGNARSAFIGQDFFLAGQTLGNTVAKNFPASGDVKVLVGVNQPTGNWSRRRADGVEAALKQWQTDHSDRKLTFQEIDAGLDYGTTGDRFGNYLTATPGLNAYIDTGFWDVGVVSVLKDRGIAPGKITVAGFDLVPDVLAAMKDGYIQYHVDQQPYLQGYVPVIEANLMKKYKLSAFDVNTGSAIVTANQVDAIEQLSKDGYR